MPSSGFRRTLPSSPFRRAVRVSAGATLSPKNASRFRLYTHKVRLICSSHLGYCLVPGADGEIRKGRISRRGNRLAYFLAAALNQERQSDGKQEACHDANHSNAVHEFSPFSSKFNSLETQQWSSQKLREPFEHNDHGRTDCHHEQRRENEQYKRENEFYSGLRRLLLCVLPPSCPQRFGIGSQSFPDAGAKPVGLDQDRRQ